MTGSREKRTVDFAIRVRDIENGVEREREVTIKRQYSSQNTRRRSSRASRFATESISGSLRQEHKGFAQGETVAEHRSSSRCSFNENVSRIALLHHLKQSDLKSPPDTAMDSKMKVSTSSMTPAGSLVAVVVGMEDENA